MDEPRVIYEDKNFIAVNKPAGLLVHRTAKGEEPTLVDWLLARYPEIKTVGESMAVRPGIVHRLDRETSGVLLVARTERYFIYLKSLFARRLIRKTYLALVSGKVEPKSGVIRKPLGIKPGTVRRTVHGGKAARAAVTEYKAIRSFERGGKDVSLLEVRPITGRTHQIRAHLASIGHAVLGDALYGKRGAPHAPRLMLHALSIEFSTEEGRRIKIEAAPPQDF